ncbi:hypothetical protein SALBM135S_04075 [Streptomyces alboniger]
MNRVLRRFRPSSRTAALSSGSSVRKRARPCDVILAGRGRSVGRARTGRSPSSAFFQYARSSAAFAPPSPSSWARAWSA